VRWPGVEEWEVPLVAEDDPVAGYRVDSEPTARVRNEDVVVVVDDGVDAESHLECSFGETPNGPSSVELGPFGGADVSADADRRRCGSGS
jgi:hypothetical protein